MTPTQMFLSQQQVVCCIPISDGKGGKRQDNHHECRASEKQNECQYYFASDSAALRSCSISNSVNSSLMLIEPGPHGNHAIASQDINAGSVIVQCLPLAHSILVPPGSLMEEEESNSNDCKKRRCARCFYQEGDVDNTISEGGGGRKIKFGRCSKCRMAYYCSRSCQVSNMQCHIMPFSSIVHDRIHFYLTFSNGGSVVYF